ncbi:MAG: hypothetical protein CBB92_06110 [Flammeovirgaceae bacterium TMED32]|nr:MAG: hypothetical protein CBB92_06110 [Flammeovirgaceae bacterium TMED32]
MKFLISSFLWSSLFCSNVQIPSESEYYRRMDLGQQLMIAGDYQVAQIEFLFVLENMEVIPTDLAYFFGRNSFHLAYYKQSVNWLNKYLQLKGTKGKYYQEAIQYLQFSEDKYMELQRSLKQDQSNPLIASKYDCGGLSKMICPVCKGAGVIFKQGIFDIHYQTCPYSEGDGYLSCKDYNLFMMGVLTLQDSLSR